jgi:hypothetical protein
MASRTVEEIRSTAGRRVTLALEHNQYEGARPYFVVAYWQAKGASAQQQLYTPFEPRARHFMALMAQDVSDPASLVSGAPRCRPQDAVQAPHLPVQPGGRATKSKPDAR